MSRMKLHSAIIFLQICCSINVRHLVGNIASNRQHGVSDGPDTFQCDTRHNNKKQTSAGPMSKTVLKQFNFVFLINVRPNKYLDRLYIPVGLLNN